MSTGVCCGCGLTFVSPRYESCYRSACRAYATACRADRRGVPKGVPLEVLERVRKSVTTGTSTGAIATVYLVAAKRTKSGSEEEEEEADERKPSKPAHVSDADVGSALTTLNTRLAAVVVAEKIEDMTLGKPIIRIFKTSLNVDDFANQLVTGIPVDDKTVRLAAIVGEEAKAKFAQFKELSAKLWERLVGRADLRAARADAAFKTAKDSLADLEESIEAGKGPLRDLDRYGLALVGSYKPFTDISERKEFRKLEKRERKAKEAAAFIDANWGFSYGPHVVEATTEVFADKIRKNDKLIGAAGYPKKKRKNKDDNLPYNSLQLDKAKELAETFISVKAEGVIGEETKRLIAKNIKQRHIKTLSEETSVKYVDALCTLFKTSKTFRVALIRRLMKKCINVANDVLGAAKRILSPRIEAHVAEHVRARRYVSSVTARTALLPFFATPEGKSFAAISRKQLNALFVGVVKAYVKANPQHQQVLEEIAELDRNRLETAIKEIARYHASNNKDEFIGRSEKENEEYLSTEDCYRIARENGLSDQQYNEYVVSRPHMRERIVSDVLYLIGKEVERNHPTANRKKESAVEVKKRKRSKLDNERKAFEEMKARATEEAVVAVEKARIVVESWGPQSEGRPIYEVLNSRALDELDPVSQQFLAAYQKVCDEGKGFGRFVTESGLSAYTPTGTLVHHMAWNALENSPIGRKRREKFVKKAFAELSYAEIERECLSLGLPYKPYAVLRDSVLARSSEPVPRKHAFAVTRIVASLYSQLAKEAPTELSQMDREIRAGDTSSHIPKVLEESLVQVLVASDEIMEDMKKSDDASALRERHEGVRRMRQLLKVAERCLRELEVTNKVSLRRGAVGSVNRTFLFTFNHTEAATLKAKLLEGHQEDDEPKLSAARAALKMRFVRECLSEWHRRPATLSADSAPRIRTTFPPYLLQTSLGRKTIEKFGEIFDYHVDAYLAEKDKQAEAATAGGGGGGGAAQASGEDSSASAYETYDAATANEPQVIGADSDDEDADERDQTKIVNIVEEFGKARSDKDNEYEAAILAEMEELADELPELDELDDQGRVVQKDRADVVMSEVPASQPQATQTSSPSSASSLERALALAARSPLRLSTPSQHSSSDIAEAVRNLTKGAQRVSPPVPQDVPIPTATQSVGLELSPLGPRIVRSPVENVFSQATAGSPDGVKSGRLPGEKPFANNAASADPYDTWFDASSAIHTSKPSGQACDSPYVSEYNI